MIAKLLIGTFALSVTSAAFAAEPAKPEKECACCKKDEHGKMACCDKDKKSGHDGDEHKGHDMDKMSH